MTEPFYDPNDRPDDDLTREEFEAAMSAPKERPILMSAPMVRACLDGSKTQTRRIMKPQPTRLEWFEHQKGWIGSFGDDAGSATNPHRMVPCPYGRPGDRLWVRETWRTCRSCDSFKPSIIDDIEQIRYEADEHETGRPFMGWGKTRVSIFMPRGVSRTTLEITEVRVQRLHHISEEDAIAEGVTWPRHDDFKPVAIPGPYGPVSGPARIAYQQLWDSINGPGSWDANPYVWALTFKRITP